MAGMDFTRAISLLSEAIFELEDTHTLSMEQQEMLHFFCREWCEAEKLRLASL